MNPIEQEEKKLEKQYKKERALLLANTREVAKTEQGKALIWEVLSMCGLYTQTFTGNSQGAFLEGRRSVGIEILQLLEDMDKTFYPNLLLSNQEK